MRLKLGAFCCNMQIRIAICTTKATKLEPKREAMKES